jgi:SAM-dependent methyltransferase
VYIMGMTAGTFWDRYYRQGDIPWDPGEYDKNIPPLLDYMNITGGRVLDIGCGTGKSLIYLAKRGFRCTGIDVSPAALREARRIAAGAGVDITWIQGAFPGGFKNPEFDLVIERGFIQHLHSRELRQVIDGVYRVLRPGGGFFTVTASRNRKGGPPGGPPRWSGGDLVKSLEERLEVVLLEETVFTPDEPGSIPAWRCAAAKRQGSPY